MVGAINAPETGNTLEAFRDLAKKAGDSTSPAGGPAGGVLNEGNKGKPSASDYTTKIYTSSWTSNGQGFTTTATTTLLVTVPAETSAAWTTKPYTSTWTSDGTTFTTTATTTLFSAIPATSGAGSAETSSSTGAAAPALATLGPLQAGALAIAAAAAMM